MKRFVEFDDATLAAHNNHQKKHVLAELDSLVQSSVFVCPIQRRYLRKIRQFVDERDCLIAGAKELKEMVFEIEDTGIGMDEEMRENLLFKMNNASLELIKTGRGVGMTNACLRLKIMTDNKARFDLETEQGVGTTVQITIPL